MHDGGYVLGADKMRHKVSHPSMGAAATGGVARKPSTGGVPAPVIKEDDDESVRSAGDFDNLTVSLILAAS
jgi:hypothetical protein